MAKRKFKEQEPVEREEETPVEEAPTEKKKPTVPGRTAIIDINKTYRKGDVVPEIVLLDWEKRGLNIGLLVE